MPCYNPIPARQDSPGRKVILWPELGTQNTALPCGKCIGCRSSHAAGWAHRCAHEATLWEYNSFATLTYADDKLPQDGHLLPDDLTRFIKRIRKYSEQPTANLQQTNTSRIRYFACGEYGRENGRPHYHIILFNCGFPDRYKVRGGEHPLYQSHTLHEMWRNGTANFGDATPASANYIAQYTLKKQGKGDHDQDGVWRPKPFLRMSQTLGRDWLAKYKDDLTHGYLVHDQHKQAIPRAYRQRLKNQGDQLIDQIELAIHKNKKIETPEQLKAHELIHTRLKELTERRNL